MITVESSTNIPSAPCQFTFHQLFVNSLYQQLLTTFRLFTKQIYTENLGYFLGLIIFTPNLNAKEIDIHHLYAHLQHKYHTYRY